MDRADAGTGDDRMGGHRAAPADRRGRRTEHRFRHRTRPARQDDRDPRLVLSSTMPVMVPLRPRARNRRAAWASSKHVKNTVWPPEAGSRCAGGQQGEGVPAPDFVNRANAGSSTTVPAVPERSLEPVAGVLRRRRAGTRRDRRHGWRRRA
jgi:hypothetical protein